jgi:hypothetical protein
MKDEDEGASRAELMVEALVARKGPGRGLASAHLAGSIAQLALVIGGLEIVQRTARETGCQTTSKMFEDLVEGCKLAAMNSVRAAAILGLEEGDLRPIVEALQEEGGAR